MPENPLEEEVAAALQRSSMGQPMTRRDGVFKVTGAARYAADNHPEGMLHAVMVVSTVARGRVFSLDVPAAKAHRGVVDVMTPANRPPLAKDPHERESTTVFNFAFRLDLLQSERVFYASQPIAVVIADTLEAATEGAALLAPRYETEAPRIGLDAGESFVPKTVGIGPEPAERQVGDIEAGLASATHRIETTYCTSAQYHNPMEPHATVAAWEGDSVFIDTPSQGLIVARARVAELLGLPPQNVHIRSPFLGGAFGGKSFVWSPQLLAVMAAKLVGRPVKLVVTRQQMFGSVGHRAPTRQLLRLGTAPDGRLTALAHHCRTVSSTFDEFFEPAAVASHSVYATRALAATHDAVRNDVGTPTMMRAPGKAAGAIALESAIDEVAEACGLDPLEFRLRNHTDIEPITGKPFSSKSLRECYASGAAHFGWSQRPLEPRQMRDEAGRLVGWGMGTAIFHAVQFPAEARAVIRGQGTAVIEIGAHDMGQGCNTSLAQIGADSLSLPVDRVELRSGTSDLPDASIAGGSAQTASAGSAILAAARTAVARLAELASADERSPLFRAGAGGVSARNGRLYRRDDFSRSESYGDILARAGLAEIEAVGKSGPDRVAREKWAMYSHGAVFAEVTVDPDLGQIRTTRLVGAFAAGRIVNPRLAKSQLVGGMIWGLSFALHERAVIDSHTGRVVNCDLTGYHVPVNSDVPSVEALLVPEEDRLVNPLGVKGVGELAIIGSGGAVANAVWHATGIRIRDFPIRLERLLPLLHHEW